MLILASGGEVPKAASPASEGIQASALQGCNLSLGSAFNKPYLHIHKVGIA